MKNIKLFEVFAGIGSQYKALKNISKKMKWKVEIVGIIEWFIPAICAYNKMHLPNKRNSLSIESREREREIRANNIKFRFKKTYCQFIN